MAIVPAPLFISSRLMAALKVDDNITLHLSVEGRDPEGRVQYRYIIDDATERMPIAEGTDLCSGVGADVDYLRTMDALLDFLQHYAEEYQSTMEGSPFYEWCYQHDTELSSAQLDLQEVIHG